MTCTVADDWKTGLTPPAKDLRPRTTDVTDTKGASYQDFLIKREILKGAYEMGWEEPSPIQEDTMHLTLAGRNIIARAKNGTGKTGAFCLPVLNKIDAKIEHPQALILVPTRELAMQTARVCTQLTKHTSPQIKVSRPMPTKVDCSIRCLAFISDR